MVNNASADPSFLDALDVGKVKLHVIETFNVNTLGPINVIQVTAKKMITARIHGSIVNVSR